MSITADTFDRTIKLLLDGKHAESLEQAQQFLDHLKIRIIIGRAAISQPAAQSALLTVVNCAARVFRGGVFVEGDVDHAIVVPWPIAQSVRDAVVALGGTANSGTSDMPVIAIGSEAATSHFGVQLVLENSVAGAAPLSDGPRIGAGYYAPAAVFAAGTALAEVFQRSLGSTRACRRVVEVDLLNVSTSGGTRAQSPRVRLPREFWLIGLGSLGQSYAWTIGLLPFRDRSAINIMLQDYDAAKSANLSTSLLTRSDDVNKQRKKTRMVAAWLEALGFRTTITERRFDEFTKRVDGEPSIALGGLDSPVPRRLLERAGFGFIADAGLGHGADDYTGIQIYTFPASRSANKVFSRGHVFRNQSTVGTPLHNELEKRGMDPCSIVTIAERAVGTPFMGAIVAGLVLSVVVRRASNLPFAEIVQANLRDNTFRMLMNETAQNAVLMTE